MLSHINAETALDVNDNGLTQGDHRIGVDSQESNGASIMKFNKVMVYKP